MLKEKTYAHPIMEEINLDCIQPVILIPRYSIMLPSAHQNE